jgi:NAD(P)-dependent dehydrogenase (short-subunit alcohol dehydrogenase family)
MDLGLTDKVALVTGSYRGTGEGVAKALAREGATVVVHGFEPHQAEAVADAICREGHRAHAVDGDITTDAGAERTAEAALDRAGAVDILVNNYGVAEGGKWLDSPTRDWIDMYEKNVLSGVRLVHHLVPGMVDRRWGRVIFVGTVGAVRPASRMPHYYAAKAGLTNMAVSLAKELANTGVTVNTVSPGLIATQEMRERFTRLAERRGESGAWEDVQRGIASSFMPIPAGFVGEVEDVGHLIAFLSSDAARYINGSNIRIDGGSADCVN